MQALESADIPCIVRAGPDLFSQPEILLLLGAISLSAGVDEFFGSPHNPKSLPNRIQSVLACAPKPRSVVGYAADALRRSGLVFSKAAENRLVLAAESLGTRIVEEKSVPKKDIRDLRTQKLRDFLTTDRPLRRVFPQQIFHWLLAEAEVETWDTCSGRGETAMFHLGALSGLITGIETPGWTSAKDYKWQVIGLCQYGAESGRTPEQPLIVQPDAVTISTIHAVKGLEFAAVFVADVCSRRFPSQNARRTVKVPMSGAILRDIDIAGLSDTDNYDGERRLMYVALTRAERFLVISHSTLKPKGRREVSQFIGELTGAVRDSGGTVTSDTAALLDAIRHAPLELRHEVQLSTSFSDLRYYLGCPHDFYLRKVLGFAPTIDQAFGYGRGVHNLLRAIHTDPASWAGLAKDRKRLEEAIEGLLARGLFYLRYTTGDPAANMRHKGVRIVADYVQRFSEELSGLTFEPEKEFETVVEYDDGQRAAMISGAIDIVRRDDPPRVTLIDFKSGDPESDAHQVLDQEEMRLQLGIYAIAAKKELQYEPEKGLVRYLGADTDSRDKSQLEVPLDARAIADARKTVVETAASIRDRRFSSGPRKAGPDGRERCTSCDFLGFCGMQAAQTLKQRSR